MSVLTVCEDGLIRSFNFIRGAVELSTDASYHRAFNKKVPNYGLLYAIKIPRSDPSVLQAGWTSGSQVAGGAAKLFPS